MQPDTAQLPAIPCAIVVIDSESELAWMNRAASSLLGIDRERLEAAELAGAVWGSAVDTAVRRVASSRHPEEIDFSPAADHLPKAMRAIIEPGEREQVIVAIHDISREAELKEALRNSRERDQLVARAIHEAIWEWDVRHNDVIWSEALLSVFGHDPATLSRDNSSGYQWWISMLHPDDRDRVVSRYERMLAGGSDQWTDEYRFRRGDGEYAVILDRAHIARDEDGKVSRVLGAMIDVTKQRRFELLRREEQQQLDLALRAGGLGSWKLDPESGTLRCSPICKSNFGHDPEAPFTYADFLSSIHPDDRERVRTDLEAAVAGDSEYEAEYRVIWPDGSLHWLSARGHTIAGEDERVRQVIGVTQDVTSRRRDEESQRFLAEAGMLLGSTLDYEITLRSLLRLTVPLLADFSILDIVREEGHIERAGIAHVDGAIEKQVSSQLSQYIPAPGHDDPILNAIRTGMPSYLPSYLPDREVGDGGLLSKLGARSLFSLPLVARGRVIGAITFCSKGQRRYSLQDMALAEEFCRRAALAVDNARLYRHANEASRAKDEFLAVLSHELRTPMTVTLGWAAMLKGGGLTAAQLRTAIEGLEESARAQAQIVNDILDVSRVITGKLQLNVSDIEIEPLIRTAVETLRSTAEAKGVHLELQLHPISGTLVGDAGRIQQILWNLLFNAVKFTPRGGEVHVEAVEDEAGSLKLVVSDSGSGIDPEFLPFVFDRFSQANAGSSREHGGLGLGLSIVRNLVDLHGGTITAESGGKDRGARFTVRLPLSQQPSRRGVMPETPAASLAGLRLLVVEDDQRTAEMIRIALERAGAEVTAVTSAASALESLRTTEFQLMVSDIAMPVEDGYSLIRKLRTGAAGVRQIPAIALTAYAGPQDRSAALNAGFNSFLPKPIEPESLAREILRVVNR